MNSAEEARVLNRSFQIASKMESSQDYVRVFDLIMCVRDVFSPFILLLQSIAHRRTKLSR